MLTNSNSISYNPSRLQSATFAGINIPLQSTYMQPIRNPNQFTQNQRQQQSNGNYYQSLVVSYIEAKLHRMLSILSNKLLFRRLKTSFDQIAFVSTLPKVKSEVQRNIVDLLNNKLSKISQITERKLKENLSFAFSRIMKTAAGPKKGIYNHRYPEIMKENEGYNNVPYDPNGRNKKVGQQVQISFINNMHKLLDSHYSIFNPEINRNPQRGSISPISPGLDKARFQSDRSKPKFAIKKQ